MATLTLKQEAFCRAYIENGGNASEAYRTAYDVSPDCKPNTVEKRACELLKHGKVAGRVDELQAEHAQRHEVTVDSLVAELEEARLAAMANPRGISAAVSAIMGKAKLLGLVVDKNEHTGKDGGPIKTEPHGLPRLTQEDMAYMKAYLGETLTPGEVALISTRPK